MKGKRRERIECFTAFKSGLSAYMALYGKNNERVKKTTITHRLALSVAKFFPPDAKVDIDYLGSDIFIKDSSNNNLVAVLWSNDYLTEKDKERAMKIHKKQQPLLTLAFSFMGDKPYVLVYRFEKEFLEYLHIYKEDFSESVIRRTTLEDQIEENKDQLLLSLRNKKQTKNKRHSQN